MKDREAWHATAHEVAKSQTRLNNWPATTEKKQAVADSKIASWVLGVMLVFVSYPSQHIWEVAALLFCILQALSCFIKFAKVDSANKREKKLLLLQISEQRSQKASKLNKWMNEYINRVYTENDLFR